MFACETARRWLDSEMRARDFRSLKVAGLLLVTGSLGFAGNFVMPSEGPVAFRRDRLPLDADAMKELSRELVTLAKGAEIKLAVGRRTAAQMLALSTALDPSNTEARELASQLQKDLGTTVTDPQEIEQSKTRIWQYLAWLEAPASGPQGMALAECLTDVMLVSDPNHPRAATLRTGQERGAWKDWIPNLSAYETSDADTARKAETPSSPIPLLTEKSVALSEAEVRTPLWQSIGQTDKRSWVSSPASLQMTAEMIPSDRTAPPPFSLVIGPASNTPSLSTLGPPILQALKKHHGSLPAGVRITVNSSALEASLLSNKRHSISAATAVLASAAISGNAPDATIIGLIDASGAFKLPTGFWDQLQTLGKGTGGRLVLPAEAADFLPSMLALEKPGFFLDHEVVLASNFSELLELSQKNPSNTLANVTLNFKEIREKADPQAVGQYLSNIFVRRRLLEIIRQAPFHYSAKMLAIQSAGNRPTLIPRNILAAELLRAIAPMNWVTERGDPGPGTLETARLNATYETCRSQVDQLLRYAEKNDRKLLDDTQEMVITLRTLDRIMRTRAQPFTVNPEAISAQAEMIRAYHQVTNELASASGDAEAVPPK